MFLGRFGVIFPLLIVAGKLSVKKSVADSLGTFDTTSITFTLLLVGVVLVVGALTFLPVLSLGPVIEQLLMISGTTF